MQEDIAEVIDSIKDEDTLRNTSSKNIIKQIEAQLIQLQTTISQSQSVAEVQGQLNESKPTSWSKFFVVLRD